MANYRLQDHPLYIQRWLRGGLHETEGSLGPPSVSFLGPISSGRLRRTLGEESQRIHADITNPLRSSQGTSNCTVVLFQQNRVVSMEEVQGPVDSLRFTVNQDAMDTTGIFCLTSEKVSPEIAQAVTSRYNDVRELFHMKWNENSDLCFQAKSERTVCLGRDPHTWDPISKSSFSNGFHLSYFQTFIDMLFITQADFTDQAKLKSAVAASCCIVGILAHPTQDDVSLKTALSCKGSLDKISLWVAVQSGAALSYFQSRKRYLWQAEQAANPNIVLLELQMSCLDTVETEAQPGAMHSSLVTAEQPLVAPVPVAIHEMQCPQKCRESNAQNGSCDLCAIGMTRDILFAKKPNLSQDSEPLRCRTCGCPNKNNRPNCSRCVSAVKIPMKSFVDKWKVHPTQKNLTFGDLLNLGANEDALKKAQIDAAVEVMQGSDNSLKEFCSGISTMEDINKASETYNLLKLLFFKETKGSLMQKRGNRKPCERGGTCIATHRLDRCHPKDKDAIDPACQRNLHLVQQQENCSSCRVFQACLNADLSRFAKEPIKKLNDVEEQTSRNPGIPASQPGIPALQPGILNDTFSEFPTFEGLLSPDLPDLMLTSTDFSTK